VTQYSTYLKGAKIEALTGLGVNLPYIPIKMPMAENTTTVPELEQYLYNLVLYGLLKVNPDSSNITNILAIHVGQGIIVRRNTTTGVEILCDNVCGLHGVIDISGLNGGATKRLVYTVAAYSELQGSSTEGNCPACLDTSQKPFVTPVIASHELTEAMVAEALMDNLNATAPEVSDICAWKVGTIYDSVRKVYVEGSALFDLANNVCYTGPSAGNNAKTNPINKADNCFHRPVKNTEYYFRDYSFELYDTPENGILSKDFLCIVVWRLIF
jgi:hypothetical protein